MGSNSFLGKNENIMIMCILFNKEWFFIDKIKFKFTLCELWTDNIFYS